MTDNLIPEQRAAEVENWQGGCGSPCYGESDAARGALFTLDASHAEADRVMHLLADRVRARTHVAIPTALQIADVV